MKVRLGTDQAVETSTKTVNADDHTKAELVDQAKHAGIPTDGDKPMLAARLSAVLHRRRVPEPRTCTVDFPENTPLAEAFTTITNPAGGLWRYHSDSPATWVESDSPGMEQLLAEHFHCAIGAPDDLEDTHWTLAGPPGVHPEDTP